MQYYRTSGVVIAALACSAMSFGVGFESGHENVWGGVRVAQAQRAQAATCEAGNMSLCVVEGRRSELGRDVPRNAARARELYQRACDGGQGAGCYYLGDIYAEGRGVVQDPQRAIELFTLGCARGSQDACGGLGDHQENDALANRLYREACERGGMRGCSGLGSLYQYGQGVPQDYARARQLFQQACDGGDMAGCTALGFMYTQGEGGRTTTRGRVSSFSKLVMGGICMGAGVSATCTRRA